MPSFSPAAATRTAYDLVAGDCARLLPDTAAEAPADLEVIRRFSATVPDDGPILDAGCGTGRMVGHLRGLGHHCLAGVDLSPGMITQARKAHPGASFTVAELAGLPYPEISFDGILAWYSIIHTAPEELGGCSGSSTAFCAPAGACCSASSQGPVPGISGGPTATTWS